jgi:DNA-binding MarR family transcriptional regulator
VLRILRGQKGNPVSLGLIQERMLDKMSNASRLVEKLKLKKLIDRRVCKSDRRQVEVVITELGLTLLTQIDEARIQMEHITSNLNENEKQIFNQLLDKLRENKE